MCHADYKIFGAVTTKLNGMRHLYHYMSECASTGPDGEGGPTIKLCQPFTNGTCMQCHSTGAKKYVETHADQLEQIRSGEISCIDCHSEVHPTALARRPQAKQVEAR